MTRLGHDCLVHEWVDDIAPALRWFFRPVPIRYPEFRRLGPLLVACEPKLAAPGGLMLYFADALPLLSVLL